MKLTKIIALAALTTLGGASAMADTLIHFKVDIGNWKLAVGSTQSACRDHGWHDRDWRDHDWRRDHDRDWRDRDWRRDHDRDWRHDRH